MNSDLKFVPMPALSEAERDERLARARQSLRESWARAEALGLGKITDEEIDAEIAEVRRERDELAHPER